MKVTGFVVNEQVNVSRKDINGLRAYAWKIMKALENGEDADLPRLRAKLAFMARSEGRSIKGTFLTNLQRIETLSSVNVIPARFRLEQQIAEPLRLGDIVF